MRSRNDVLTKAGVDLAKYSQKNLNLHNTEFLILGRSTGFGIAAIESALRRAWPIFTKYLGVHVDMATLVDYEAPIGGGSLSHGQDFTIGIYSSKEISEDHQKFINQITGWGQCRSTGDYIEKQYSIFENPTQAYVDEIVFHELGHLFFGWGVLGTDIRDISKCWVALGLGIVYDQLVWNAYYELPSPMLASVCRLWEQKYSKNLDVDQKLIFPDTSKDSLYGLDRMQIYAHGKAASYLKSLRLTLGESFFDKAISNLLAQENSKELTYDLLISYLENIDNSHLISALEKQFSVR